MFVSSARNGRTHRKGEGCTEEKALPKKAKSLDFERDSITIKVILLNCLTYTTVSHTLIQIATCRVKGHQ